MFGAKALHLTSVLQHLVSRITGVSRESPLYISKGHKLARLKYVVAGGPNAPISNVSLIMGLELAVDYAFSCVRKMQVEGIASLEVEEDAANEFMEQRDEIMKDLVWTESYSSW